MCGICGLIRTDGRPADADAVRRMSAAVAHRGPDDEGLFCDGPAALGHRRLAVIDLSPEARQPLVNEDGSVRVVFNGEIYNFAELRAGLERRGHVFRSRSDTEVIVHLYEEHGEGCLDHLRGMFALAVWDAPRRRLLLARDRLGKKPLYWAEGAGRLLFASEIKAILAEGSTPRVPDALAIHHYLTYDFVPSPLTAFRGIRRLPPAHFLVLEGGRVRIERYWRLAYGPKAAAPPGELEAELLRRLREAVRLRLVSDVPLGAFLSGGVDSSAVVACMAEAAPGAVRTFSVGFREQEFDETPWARAVAERFGTRHTELLVEPRALEVLPRLVWHFDEPFADSSAIPSWYVAQAAREHVTVVLNGDGGDEDFAGYGRYVANDADRRLEARPGGRLWRRARLLARRGRDRMRGVPAMASLREDLRRLSPDVANGLRLCRFRPEEKAWLYHPAFTEAAGAGDSLSLLEEAAAAPGAEGLVDRALAADIALYLPDDLLVKVDVTSMAHGLEARSPLLDHELAEFAARLPERLKLDRGRTKVAFRRALRDILPPELLERPKMGFGVPLARWFRGELRDFVRDTLLDGTARGRGIFREEAVRALLAEHLAGRRDRSSHLWNLVMLEQWHRTFIDPAVPAPPA